MLEEQDTCFCQSKRRAGLLYPILLIQLIVQKDLDNKKEEVKPVRKEMADQNLPPAVAPRLVQDVEIP